MSVSDIIAVVCSLITIVCAIISFRQARAAKSFSDALKAAKRRIGLLTVAERLRTAQDPVGQLPQASSTLRGNKPDVAIAKIRVEFDRALSSLEKRGPGAAAREYLEIAQKNLDRYEDSLRRIVAKEAGSSLDIDAMRAVRTAVQNAIVEVVQAAEGLEA